MSKNNEHVALLQAEGFFRLLKGKHLLLDTNVLIDASNHPAEFGKFFNECGRHNVTLVTIQAVVIEFLKGSIDADKEKIKKKLIDNIVFQSDLPTPSILFTSFIPQLVTKYGKSGATTTLTDFILAAVTMYYKNDLFLLTRNYKDFPQRVFSLKTHLIASMDRSLITYGVYNYEDSM